MKLSTTPLHWGIKRFFVHHARQVERSMLHPRETQTATFARLHELLEGTEIAAQTGFDRCRSLEDCRRLPVADSERMRPLFKRAFEQGAAARRVFGRSRIVGFARTSGTYGEPTDVPLTRAAMQSLDRTTVRMVASHLHTSGEWQTLLSGKRLLLGSRPRLGTSPTGLPISDMSGLMATRTPRPVRHLFLPNPRDVWLPDWPEKAERILADAHGKQVISITGIPALAMDLARRARARYGVSHLDGVWPHLRQYVYGGLHLSDAQKKAMLHTWFAEDRAVRFFEVYFTTEGQLGFSFEPDLEGMALNLLENFYLFRTESGDALLAHEVEEGRIYSLCIITPGGLVNYAMGDRIEVLSSRPLLIRVAGREKDELSMTGEKITLAQLDLALEAVGLGPAELGLHAPVVWIEQGERPNLVWGIPEPGEHVEHLDRRLDDALCRLNTLYNEARVHERVVGAARVVFLPPAVFERYRDARLGTGQFKPRRMFSSQAEFSSVYGWSPSTPASLAAGGSTGS